MGSANFIKSGIWYTVGNILIKGISFIALPLFTRLLSPEDFGKYNVFLSYENILNVILGLGLSGTIKVAFFDYKEDFNKYFSSIVSLTVISTILFDLMANLLILILFRNSMPSFWDTGLINLLICSSLATALYSLISTKYVIEAKYRSNLAISFLYTITNVVLSVLLCLTIFTAHRYLARILGQTLPLILLTFGIGVFYIRKYRNIFNYSYWHYSLKLGLPLILHMLSMVLLMQIGKLQIDYFLGSSATGIYSVAVTIASILTILLGSFDNAWAPWFYRGLAGEEGINLKKGNNKISAFFAFATAVFILVSPELVKIMAAAEYQEAIYSLIPLIIAVFVNFMYLFAVNQEYYYKKTKTIAFGTVVATITCISINYFFIPVCGYVTAAFADLIGKGVLYIIHTYVVRKLKKQPVVSNKLLMVLLLALCLISVVTVLCRDIIFVRILIVIVLCAIALRPVQQFIMEHRKQQNIKL